MEIIRQSDAARLRKVSRARIGQLVGTKIRQALDSEGNPIRGMVVLEDVLNLPTGKSGRPALTEEEKLNRNVGHKFAVGSEVIWLLKTSYDYRLSILAKILKIGNKKVKIEFKSADDCTVNTIWVSAEDLLKFESLYIDQYNFNEPKSITVDWDSAARSIQVSAEGAPKYK